MSTKRIRPFYDTLPPPPLIDQWCIAERVGTNDTTYTPPMEHDEALDLYSQRKMEYASMYATRAMPDWFVVEDTSGGGRAFVASVALVRADEVRV